jgi:hypothetical protein
VSLEVSLAVVVAVVVAVVTGTSDGEGPAVGSAPCPHPASVAPAAISAAAEIRRARRGRDGVGRMTSCRLADMRL